MGRACAPSLHVHPVSSRGSLCGVLPGAKAALTRVLMLGVALEVHWGAFLGGAWGALGVLLGCSWVPLG